ncbi:MAG: XdhC family protein [Dongiaceae bacterium]
MKRTLLGRALAERDAGRPAAMVTDLASGAQALCTPTLCEGDLALSPAALAVVRQALRDDRAGMADAAGSKLFVQIFNPPLRLILVGAVHISQALAPIAALAGYRVTVVDPRRSFASEARFPGVELVAEWPEEAMAALAIDSRTAVVTLTHDPKLDDPALQAALRSPAFYVGALGSRKTHAGRLKRLAAAGFAADETARIHGPVGLAIGALSPAEIAISILAEITAVLHRALPAPAEAAA